jgi:hypothetical protein
MAQMLYAALPVLGFPAPRIRGLAEPQLIAGTFNLGKHG